METDVDEGAPEAPTAARAVLLIPRNLITPSPTNPRKTFDAAKLQELAVSIESVGILSPVLLRPAPVGEGGHYELVLGERRWRAAEIAGLDLIPAFVEQLTSVEAAERQLVENSQRVDVSPLEEGMAYAGLIRDHGHSIETLMTRVGRSRSHIYSRMRLTSLAPAVQRSLEDGRLGAAVADLIATIGDPKLQEQACRVVLGEGKDDELAELGISYEVIERTMRQPLSYRAARDLIRQRYMLRLAQARFDTADATLTAAGACGPCPHRTGNQPELPGMPAASGDDLCSSPPCFDAKTRAAWARAAAAADERGLEVIERGRGQLYDVFDRDGITIAERSPYVDLGQRLPAHLARAGAPPKTWGELLGKRAGEVRRVLVQDEAGAPRELVDREAAVEILRELGKVERPEPRREAPSKDRGGTGERSASKSTPPTDPPTGSAAELNRRVRDRLKRDVIEAASKGVAEKKEMAIWRWLVVQVVRVVALTASHPLVSDLDQKKPWGEQIVAKATTAVKARAILLGLLFGDLLDALPFEQGRPSHDDPHETAAIDLLKLLGVDLMEVAQEVSAAIAAETKTTKPWTVRRGGAA